MKFTDLILEDSDNPRKQRLKTIYIAFQKGISKNKRNITNNKAVHYKLPDNYTYVEWDKKPIAQINKNDIEFYSENNNFSLERIYPTDFELYENFYNIRKKFEKFDVDIHLIK